MIIIGIIMSQRLFPGKEEKDVASTSNECPYPGSDLIL